MKLASAFEKAEVGEAEIKALFANTEEEISFTDKQSQSLSLMMRYRLLIGRLNRKQGLMINSFYVLRESLNNFKRFAEGMSSDIERGEESREKGSFMLPEMYGGGNAAFASTNAAPAKGGKAAPAKAAPAKAGAKGGKEEEKTEEQAAAEE